MTTHWITIWKGQTTSHIARSITICWSIRPPLAAMVGNSGMGNADQFATLSSPCLINSYLLTTQMTAAMRAVAMTTVRFLTQPIQTSSCLLGTLMINGLEEKLQDLQEQNLQHGNVQDT